MKQMETIIASNLQELDISTETFYEACLTSRNSRDINRTVYEKMLAMEDFTVFKKIMVKRNTELQYEAMMSYKHFADFADMRGEIDDLPDPEELEQMLEQRDDDYDISGHTEEEVRGGERTDHAHCSAVRSDARAIVYYSWKICTAKVCWSWR